MEWCNPKQDAIKVTKKLGVQDKFENTQVFGYPVSLEAQNKVWHYFLKEQGSDEAITALLRGKSTNPQESFNGLTSRQTNKNNCPTTGKHYTAIVDFCITWWNNGIKNTLIVHQNLMGFNASKKSLKVLKNKENDRKKQQIARSKGKNKSKRAKKRTYKETEEDLDGYNPMGHISEKIDVPKKKKKLNDGSAQGISEKMRHLSITSNKKDWGTWAFGCCDGKGKKSKDSVKCDRDECILYWHKKCLKNEWPISKKEVNTIFREPEAKFTCPTCTNMRKDIYIPLTNEESLKFKKTREYKTIASKRNIKPSKKFKSIKIRLYKP